MDGSDCENRGRIACGGGGGEAGAGAGGGLLYNLKEIICHRFSVYQHLHGKSIGFLRN